MKKILVLDGVTLSADMRQYIVTVSKSNLVHYLPTLELALEDMIDLYERKQVSKTVWRSAGELLEGVERIHQEFYKKYFEKRGKNEKAKNYQKRG